jgi:diamine N-acetyltransferase
MIRLEPLSLDHLDHVMSWVNDREVMTYFAGHQTDISRDEEERYLRQYLSSKTDRAFSIFAEDGAYVGQCSINQIYWPARNGRLFLVITKENQRKGYGAAAIKTLLETCWAEGLHKVWLIVRSDNRAAQAMYLKLGFSFEGLLKDEYCVGGRYFDMIRMGIINPSEL